MKISAAPRGMFLALAASIALVAACSRPPPPQVTCNPPAIPALDLSRLPAPPACPPAPACTCSPTFSPTIMVGQNGGDAGSDTAVDAAADTTPADSGPADTGVADTGAEDAGSGTAVDSGAVPADTTPAAQPPAPTPEPPVAAPAVAIPGNVLGPAIQARVNLQAAQRFCRITAVQVATGQRAAPDAPCASGEIGCWRRASSARVPTCASSGDAPGCVGGDGTAWGCSGDAQHPNAWVFRCGANVVCTTDGLATAAGVQPAH